MIFISIIMAVQINNILGDWIKLFKTDILKHVKSPNLTTFIQNYPPLTISDGDLKKRKRQRTIVPLYERCMAKSSNGRQCTRRRRNGENFCGTHLKGTPNGTIQKTTKTSIKTKEVFTKDINGIVYYMDNDSNIYHMQDILENRVNPRIVLKYKKDGEKYTIYDAN